MFDYHRKLSDHEIEVSISLVDDQSFYRDLIKPLNEYSRKYGFVFKNVSFDEITQQSGSYVIRHLILLSSQAYEEQLVQKCKEYLNIYDTASLGFTYLNEKEMLEARLYIERDKKIFNDRVNFLRPDVYEYGKFRVSHQKILDNAICDSVRVKFDVIHVCDSIEEEVLKNIVPFFKSASSIYRNYSLFHRSHMDGYFAIRINNCFAITATKTDKIDMDIERISLIHEYEESTNTIKYSGKFLPSSDSVELAIICNLLPQFNAIIHSHASDKFTRNKNWEKQTRVPPLPYGEAQLGYSLAQALDSSTDGFVIMEEHGEVFADSDWPKLIEKVSHYCQLSSQLDGERKKWGR